MMVVMSYLSVKDAKLQQDVRGKIGEAANDRP
jgi:hypothetical protein